MNGSPSEHHPEPSDLERFMRGELRREEARAIVRHMLTNCQRCVSITRRCWERGERVPGLETVVREIVGEERGAAGSIHDEPGLI